MYKDYVCVDSGILNEDIWKFAQLETGDLLHGKDKKESLQFLSIYGSNEQEITDNIEKHISNCESCQEIYSHNKIAATIAACIANALVEKEQGPRWRKIEIKAVENLEQGVLKEYLRNKKSPLN